jgi:hypothetical protein
MTNKDWPLDMIVREVMCAVLELAATGRVPLELRRTLERRIREIEAEHEEK